MVTKTLIASFDSRRRTANAQSRLQRAGIGSEDIQVEEMTLQFRNLFKLRAVVEATSSRVAVDALWDAGALDIEQRQNPTRTGEWFEGQRQGA